MCPVICELNEKLCYFGFGNDGCPLPDICIPNNEPCPSIYEPMITSTPPSVLVGKCPPTAPPILCREGEIRCPSTFNNEELFLDQSFHVKQLIFLFIKTNNKIIN